VFINFINDIYDCQCGRIVFPEQKIGIKGRGGGEEEMRKNWKRELGRKKDKRSG